MKFVVVGGSGLIGKQLVSRLQGLGHETVAASPSLGINAMTGEGLAEALKGADAVVDVANSPSFADEAVLEFFATTTRNLLAAEAEAGVKHHVALSVVGTDGLLQSGYFRGKMAQEELIQASPVPYTIVRATQFFDFAEGIAYTATEGDIVRLPSAWVQPIASEDVAAALVDYTLEAPVNGITELAGPDKLSLDEFVRQALKAKGDARQVVGDTEAHYFGTALQDHSLVPAGDHPRIAPTRLTDWLAASVSEA
ncbi:NmrA family transcriptional regulator [Paenibacillus sp. IHB B 3415]|uniref:SDR family oxidoreductase n=1 Tax=Paenibacillus sp. IHB B 3415 TaxID=867080 RepID=UPI000574FBCA|nr:SDR family oxidoreductase [Paenibacillus sp. IHB B 3415]KHL96692.1 NmrA family transcriptional regulator [Paenibacillus sp. IHB B 3415]